MTWLAGLFANKAAVPALKILGALIAALVALTLIYFCYRYVTNLQQAVVDSNRTMVREEMRANAAEANLSLLQAHVASTAKAVEKLGERDRTAETQWSGFLNQTLDLPPGRTSHETAADLNRLNAAANRMLEQVTEYGSIRAADPATASGSPASPRANQASR